MTHAFISYKHDPSMNDFIELLKRKLEEAGLVWWIDAKLRPSEDWRQGIDNAIRASFAVVVVMTEEAKKSEYVTYEWAFGVGCNKPIVTLLLEDVKLHPRLESLQYLNFKDGKRAWDDLILTLKGFRNAGVGGLVIPEDAPIEIKRAKDNLEGTDDDKFVAAVKSLTKLTHPVASEVIDQLLAYREPHKRYLATVTLSEVVGDTRAIPMLLEFANDFNGRRCQGAIDSLVQWAARNDRVLESLIEYYLTCEDFTPVSEFGSPFTFRSSEYGWSDTSSVARYCLLHLSRFKVELLATKHGEDSMGLCKELQDRNGKVLRRLRIFLLLKEHTWDLLTAEVIESLLDDHAEALPFIDSDKLSISHLAQEHLRWRRKVERAQRLK
jgi:hypothetical protein